MSDVNPCFSQDIWIEILKELPVKTLGKCRCVCKSWNSLIISPTFMAAHLTHYTQNEANSMLLCKELYVPKVYEKCVIFRNSVQFTEWKSLYTSVFPFMLKYDWWPCFHLVGSVHGLLCLSDHADLSVSDRILIWNPLLQKSIKLPLLSTDDESSVLGFGYDDRKSDHKVVKISHSRVKDGATTTTPLIEIYSIKDRTWRMISGYYLVRNAIRNVSSSQCYFNGVIHWVTLESTNGLYRSLAKWALLFNVVEERFDKMKLPEAVVMEDSGDFGIFEYQSKLAVSLCEYTADIHVSLSCHIWVQGEYNVGSSWRKLFYVSEYDCCHTGPIQYLGRDDNEELIGIVRESTGEFLSYNRKIMQAKGLGRYRSSESTRFTAYSESLVLLDQQIDALTHDELQRTNGDRDPFLNMKLISL